MMKIRRLASNLFLLLIVGTLSLGCKTAPDLTVRIVPTSANQESEKVIQLWDPEDRFLVVITNNSGQRRTVWEQWCMWGYFNLSFTFTDNHGKSIAIKKNSNRLWTINYPDPFMLDPGGHYVLPINLFDGDWVADGEPLDSASWPEKGTLTATYTIYPETESKKFEVWCGEISSDPQAFTFSINKDLTILLKP